MKSIISIACIFVVASGEVAICNVAIGAPIHRWKTPRNIKRGINTACLTPDCKPTDVASPGRQSAKTQTAKATNIAQKAAQEAKAASDAQQVAGQQAAHQVKSQLAEKASEAAQAAQVALGGKQALVEKLEEELREAEIVVQEEGESLHNSQEGAQAAVQSAQLAAQQLKALAAAVQLEQQAVAEADATAQAIQKEYAEKTQLVDAAKHRVEILGTDLQSSRTDLKNTLDAAKKATDAAEKAKENANRNRRKSQEDYNVL